MGEKKDLWKIINGDCLEVMETMDDQSVDYVFTSPPYNDSGGEMDWDKNRHRKYKFVEHRDDWFDWQVKCIDEMLRVSRKYVMYNVQAILSNKENVYRLIGHYADKIHQILIWYKPNAQPQPYDNRIGNSYEMVIVIRAKGFDVFYVNDKHYNNVIVQNINADRRYCNKHRALMSQPFADEIIRVFTGEGETILDPFCGLATTGIACVKQGRKFIGIEKDTEYAEIAKERIFEDTAQYSLFDY